MFCNVVSENVTPARAADARDHAQDSLKSTIGVSDTIIAARLY